MSVCMYIVSLNPDNSLYIRSGSDSGGQERQKINKLRFQTLMNLCSLTYVQQYGKAIIYQSTIWTTVL